MPTDPREPAAIQRAVGRNLLVGWTLAIVTLPQAIAFSVTLAGLPPHFGIYAAIWGVLFTALLNPSRVFSGGPNTTMSAAVGITLLPVAPPFGADYLGYALTLFLLAGLVQVLFVVIRPLGRMLDLISEPVINGLICGIGLFLIFKSLTSFAGLPINTQVEWPLWIAWQSFLAVLEIGNLYAIQIGLVTLVTALLARLIDALRHWAILLGVLAGTAYSEYLNATIGLAGTLIEQIANLSSVGLVKPSLPTFEQEAMSDIISIMPGAVSLALLGLFQTVAAMRRMNRKIGSHTDSHVAIRADAMANCLLPFLSSLPTCASFNRMWLVQGLGGHSRWSSVCSAVILLLMVLFLAPVIAIIPMPAMAAVIMLLGANMIKWEDIKPHLKDRREAIVFVGSFLSVLFLDLFGAVVVGSLLAIAYSKWAQAHPIVTVHGPVMKIRGNIYYGSLPVIESSYHRARAAGSGVTLDFSDCQYIDPEGVRWLATIKEVDGTVLADRRKAQDRRTQDRRKPGDEKRAAGRRRRKVDRRSRSEF